MQEQSNSPSSFTIMTEVELAMIILVIGEISIMLKFSSDSTMMSFSIMTLSSKDAVLFVVANNVAWTRLGS